MFGVLSTVCVFEFIFVCLCFCFGCFCVCVWVCVALFFFCAQFMYNYGLLDKKPKVVAIFYSRHYDYDYNVEPYWLRQGTMACVTSIIISFPSKGSETSHSKQFFFPVKVSALTKCQCNVGEGLFFCGLHLGSAASLFCCFPKLNVWVIVLLVT